VKIGQIPETPLVVRTNFSFGPYLCTLRQSGSVYNLTGCTIAGQIREPGENGALIATFDCTIESPATAGQFTWGLDSADTDFAQKSYVYDLALTTSGGDKIVIAAGPVLLETGVTRA
jgi:hypothetical protein